MAAARERLLSFPRSAHRALRHDASSGCGLFSVNTTGAAAKTVQARIASIAGQSAQPTAESKRRGLPCAGFAATQVTHAPRTFKFSKAP